MAPVLMAAGLPVEGIGILLGADTIPDMFRTTANVTGHLAVATAVAGKRAGGQAGSRADLTKRAARVVPAAH
jgi:Na+/H+-dicarboxylate symporter